MADKDKARELTRKLLDRGQKKGAGGTKRKLSSQQVKQLKAQSLSRQQQEIARLEARAIAEAPPLGSNPLADDFGKPSNSNSGSYSASASSSANGDGKSEEKKTSGSPLIITTTQLRALLLQCSRLCASSRSCRSLKRELFCSDCCSFPAS